MSADDFEWFHDVDDVHPIGHIPAQAPPKQPDSLGSSSTSIPQPDPSHPAENPRVRQLRGQTKMTLRPDGTLAGPATATKVAGTRQTKRRRADSDSGTKAKVSKRAREKKKVIVSADEAEDGSNSSSSSDSDEGDPEQDLERLEGLTSKDVMVSAFPP